MSASRRAAKVDGNQTAIVDALRAAGCSVQSLAAIGGGVPDLLVGIGHYWNVLLEVKDPAQDPCKRKLTAAQKRWHADWLGTAHLVETAEQALEIIAFYRSGRKAA